MEKNRDFYILEYASCPGTYYIDNQFGVTDNALIAEHYPTPEEALKYFKDPSKWNVCKVHLDIQHV